MTSHPGSSLRVRLTSPPPSRAHLELQKQGLELAVSPSSNNLQVTAQPTSGRSTPSDLDKPLPLEPFEDKRRSSSVYSVDRGSVYSTDTSITNILRLYGEYRDFDLDDLPPVPALHQPQAYRDTVAPLLIKRLSLSNTPSPQPILKNASREAMSIYSVRSAGSHAHALPNNKGAPSFTEFSRALQERKDQMVSPLSSSSESHRQAAYDALAQSSPHVSSVELSVSVSQTPPLPDAMSVTISDADEPDLLPPPLGMSSSSLPSPPYDDWNMPAEFNPALHHDQLQDHLPKAGHGKSWSQNWLQDEFISQSPQSSPKDVHTSQEFPLLEKEQGRVISYAEGKDPGMRKDSFAQKRARNSSARSSVQQGVGNLLRSLSRRSAAGKHEWPEHKGPPRERQLAIPATPYQVYGAAVFSDKLQKKQRKEAERQARQEQEAQRARRQRTKSISLGKAYGRGQDGIVNAMKKLTGKSAHSKRQKTLKDSIVFLGPADKVGVPKHFVVENEDSWI